LFGEFGFTPQQLGREYEVHTDTARNVLNGKSHQGLLIRSSLRKLTDDQARQIRQWAAPPPAGEGLGEARIRRRLGGIVGCSTIRQVINRESYQDVV
jgi:hypothetical protein